MTPVYVVNPYLQLVRYASRCFAYDARVVDSPLVEIATGIISGNEFAALELLKTRGFLLEARSESDILAYLGESLPDISISFEALVSRNWLKEYVSFRVTMEQRVLRHLTNRYEPEASRREPPGMFDQTGSNLHIFSAATFFNLPGDVDPEPCHVGLLGIPHASLGVSLGTEAGPLLLRLQSRSICWFDIFQRGVYSEVSLSSGRPEILCKGAVVRDAGNIDPQGLTVAEVAGKIDAAVAEQFIGRRVYPIFIGGDHAITYSIVRSYLSHIPNIGLLHLDAHNDLFYTPRVTYTHAAPMSNLLRRTAIERIVSIGLRGFIDRRTDVMEALYRETGAAERLTLWPLTAAKQMILNQDRLEAELTRLADRPYYLTLDLDVLSDSASGEQVSTPFGPGLEWHELLHFLATAFRKLDVVGCDVVEHNGLHGYNRDGQRSLLNSLLLLIIDGLSRCNERREGKPRA
jgi:arginase family enzyme